MNSIIKIYAVEVKSEPDMHNPCSAVFQPHLQKILQVKQFNWSIFGGI